MSFQNFINDKISEKAAIEAALVRVIAELQSANAAAPAVDKVVAEIQGLMVILNSSPSTVITAVKQAIQEACGDISLLMVQPREVSTLVVPRFISDTTTTVTPVLTDVLGETEVCSDATVSVETTTTAANEIQPFSPPSKDTSEDSTPGEANRPKRRTQAGFDRKVKEWCGILNSLDADNYESSIAQVDDEYKFWTEGTKFNSSEIEERLERAIASWTSVESDEVGEVETTVKVFTESFDPLSYALESEDSQDTGEPLAEDLSSFDVEEDELTEEEDELTEEERLFDNQIGEWYRELKLFNIPEDSDNQQSQGEAIFNRIQEIEAEYTRQANKLNTSVPVFEKNLSEAKDKWNTFLFRFHMVKLQEDLEATPNPVQDETQNFLERLSADNLSESGLGDLQEEIRQFYGIGNIPQELLDAAQYAWEKFDEDSDDEDSENDIENLVDFVEEINETYSDSETEIYTGYVPEEEELKTGNEPEPTTDTDDKINQQIIQDNLDWQKALNTNCETREIWQEWDTFIAKALSQDPNSVTPETYEALEAALARIESREAEQAEQKEVVAETLISGWLSRTEMAFDLVGIQNIWNEIKEANIIPSMELVRALDAAKVRLTPVEKVAETDQSQTAVEEPQLQNADDDIYGEVEEGVSEEVTATAKTVSNGFDDDIYGEVETGVSQEATATSNGTSDHISISKINTSGIFNFRTLDGKIEQRQRYDEKYILPPGYKVYEKSTNHTHEITTWEELKSLNPLAREEYDRLPLKSLQSRTRQAPKTSDRTEDFAVVSDEQAAQLIEQYRANAERISLNAVASDESKVPTILG